MRSINPGKFVTGSCDVARRLLHRAIGLSGWDLIPIVPDYIHRARNSSTSRLQRSGSRRKKA